MNENERELLDGLRALDAKEPREPSARVERFLLAQFRARARRRRLTRWGSAAAGIAAAAAIAVAVWVAPRTLRHSPSTISHGAPRELPKSGLPDVALPTSPQPRASNAIVQADEVAASFYPTPDADALPPLETAMVVRVQLPMSSLRWMGLPIAEDLSGDPVQADVLLGQDGLARGVRLVPSSLRREP
ncbi:MAG TPA: hypothetical protein VEV17_26870 [Bryobacteraceae bacterium]|nr:hypothetical protein [Bryobacteraceae bacterium]